MKRFKNILVVYDSEADNRALSDRAVRLAQRNQAPLMVVDVIEEAAHEAAKPVSPEAATEAQGLAIHIIEEFPSDTTVPPASESLADVWERVTPVILDPG